MTQEINGELFVKVDLNHSIIASLKESPNAVRKPAVCPHCKKEVVAVTCGEANWAETEDGHIHCCLLGTL